MKRLVLLATVLLLSAGSALAQNTQAPVANWQPFEEAVAAAQQSGKKVLVDVYAPWCTWCRRMQSTVYADAGILDYLDEHFEITRLNVDDAQSTLQFKGHQVTPKQLGRAFQATGTPTTVFLDAEGGYITRLPGFVDPPTFQKVITYIGSDAFERQSLQEFMEAVD